jgi:hypothetical protein
MVFLGKRTVNLITTDGNIYLSGNPSITYSREMLHAKPISNLKVGDKVTLRQGLKVSSMYGDITLLRDMVFEGEREILEVVGNLFYTINIARLTWDTTSDTPGQC